MNRLLKPLLTVFLIFFCNIICSAQNREDSVITIYSANPEVASRTYAIILNGGIDKYNNYSGYYIHCSWIYKVLQDGYGIPKSHIWAVIADGTDPKDDYINSKGKPQSSNPDLDGDGVDEIRYSATRVNVKKTIDEIASCIRKDDNLFIFVADHGHTDSEDIDISTICLWNEEELYDYELSEWLSPVFDKGATVCMLLGQCYSGGFLDNFTRPGCVVMAAAPKGVPGTSTVIDKDKNILVDLLYHWTAAITGTDERGKPFPSYAAADLDEDGSVTMEEAFRYAWGKMGNAPLSEVYRATPAGMGEFAFNRIPTGPDIYIRDNMSDTGYEPNSTTDISWDSPDIWVRNHPDGHTCHQNPYLTPDHTTSSVYVRVHNRSPRAYPSSGGEYLHCYWTRASTSAIPADWKGDGENGGTVGSAPIPALAPGDSAVIRLDWPLPATLSGNMTASGSPWHLSLQAEITSDPKPGPKGGKGNDTFTDPLSSRRIARKTLSVIDSRDISRGASVMVRDVSSGPSGLEVRERPQTWNKGIHSKAEVILSIPADGNTARIPSFGGSDPTVTPGLLATPPGLVTVTLRPKGLLVTDSYWKDCPYTFDLIQHDSTGKIVGGAAFTIDYEMTATLPIDSLVVGRTVTLTADTSSDSSAEETSSGSPLTYWLDKDGNTVGTGSSLTVRPTRGSDSFTAVSVTPDGRVRSGSVSLSPRAGIREVRTDATGRPETVELLGAEDSDDSRIRILSLTHPETAPTDTMVPRGATSVSVDAGKLPAGICSVAYISGGRTVDELRIPVK